MCLIRTDDERSVGREALLASSASLPVDSGSSDIALTGGGSEAQSRPPKPIMMIFLVGGLTFIEIAAFRHLSRDPNFPFSIVMATTKIINGNSLLESLCHNDGKPL